LAPQSLSDQFFLKRFEPDGDEFIFRPNLRAPGIRVTREERDQFFADFKRWNRWGTWVFAAAICIAIAGYIFATVSLHFEVPGTAQLAIEIVFFGAVTLAFLAYTLWVQKAVQRALKNRPCAVPGRSKEEARRAHFKQLTWSQIGGLAALFVAMQLRMAARNNLLEGWNRLWLLFDAVVLAFLAAAAFRKWRYDRDDRSKQTE
jgi:hypothetical protein